MPKFQGAIFDVDGVLVDSPHEKAWRQSLQELMESSWRGIRGRTTWSPDAFTALVYQQYVAGKPRMNGARAALDYFGVPDAGERAVEYAEHKQELVVRLIQAGDFTAYPDALRLVIAAKDAGIPIADASSSKNAGLFLRQIRLDTFAQEHGISSPTLRPGLTLHDYFDADVSGRDFAHGKPDPEIFLTAAHELGVEPRFAVVIEDASAGVEAAKAGGMAAIGIARAGDADLLSAADADLVVTTLDDVDTTAFREGRLARRQALCRGGISASLDAGRPSAVGLIRRSGDLPAAATAYADAARRTTDVAERDHLVRQAARARAADRLAGGAWAPQPEIEVLRARFGWSVPWYSSHGTSFNDDMGLTAFGLSVLLRDGDEVFRGYFTTARGVDRLRLDFNLLDLTPYGRQEQWEDSPEGWPQDPTMSWLRPHDEY